MPTAEDLIRNDSGIDERAARIFHKETVADAARLMKHYGVGLLPVVDEEERLIGVVTWQDLVDGVLGGWEFTQKRSVNLPRRITRQSLRSLMLSPSLKK